MGSMWLAISEPRLPVCYVGGGVGEETATSDLAELALALALA